MGMRCSVSMCMVFRVCGACVWWCLPCACVSSCWTARAEEMCFIHASLVAHTLPESVAVSYAESAVFPLVCVTDEGSTAGADDSADTHTASVSASATLCSTWCLPLSYSTHHTLSPTVQTSMAPLSLLHIHTAQHLQSLSLSLFFFFYFILFFAHSGVSVLCVSLPVQCGRDYTSALL